MVNLDLPSKLTISIFNLLFLYMKRWNASRNTWTPGIISIQWTKYSIIAKSCTYTRHTLARDVYQRIIVMRGIINIHK